MPEDHVTDLTKGIVGDAEWERRWREGESHWHNDKNVDPYVYHDCLHVLLAIENFNMGILNTIYYNSYHAEGSSCSMTLCFSFEY